MQQPRRMPIEWYLIILPTIIFLLWVGVSIATGHIPFSVPFSFALGAQLGGGKWFGVGFFVLGTYTVFKAGRICIQESKVSGFHVARICKALWPLARSGLFLFAVVVCILSISSIASILLFNSVTPERIIPVSNAITETEFSLFGFYPHFAIGEWLASFPSFTKWIIHSYDKLFLFVSATFIAAFVTSTALLRRFLLGFFLVFALSFPIWFLFPAVSPLEYQLENRFNVSLPEHTRDAMIHYIQNPKPLALQEYLSLMREFWIHPETKVYAVSANPSMHVAWALLVFATFSEISVVFGIILLPWLLMCIVGTLLTLNHYLTDVISGGAVFAVGFLLAKRIVAREDRQDIGKNFFLIPELLQRDVRKYWKILKTGKRQP